MTITSDVNPLQMLWSKTRHRSPLLKQCVHKFVTGLKIWTNEPRQWKLNTQILQNIVGNHCLAPTHIIAGYHRPPYRSIPLTRPITALSRCRHVDERSRQKTTKIIRQFFTRRARSTQPVCCSLLNTVKLHKLNGIENIADSDPAAWPTVKHGRSQP